jgi:serine/threonine-protein kinase
MLSVGTKLGPYEIQSPLGAGGMGEVYRASDTKLKRDVALKVLPEALAKDADRMARFQREAHVLASLNHSGIASIYGLEESGGVRALVIELVEGPTLAGRIAQGPIPLDEALPMAKQIAEALEYAHEHGIIHRDLKPANIKVTRDGAVKVLDFGLAKALADDPASADVSNSPTLSMAATKAGIILGTAAYMSPEQARGKPADRRADIWSFGVVLYEMLTGKMAFRGETSSDVLAAVIKEEPGWDLLPARTPAAIRKLLRRCLEKDPERRLQAIGEARIEIEQALAHPQEAAPASLAAGAIRSPWSRLVPWGIVVLLVLALLLQGWRQFSLRVRSPKGAVRLSLNLPPDISLGGEDWPPFTLPPDGTKIVFVGAQEGISQLSVRRLDQSDATPIRGTQGAHNPFFSPDARWVGFTVGQKMQKVAVEGGPPVDLADASWGGGCWGTNGELIYTQIYNGGLWKLPAEGGPPVVLTSPDRSQGELGHWWPQILPGGETVLFTAFSTPIERSRILAQSLKTGKQTVLVEGAVFGRYVPSGHVMFARGETVFAVPFDLGRLEVTGAPVPVLEGVATFPQNGLSLFAVSDAGVLAYLPSSAMVTEHALVSVSRMGKLQIIREGLHPYPGLRLSPDGQQVALSLREGGHPPDVWVLNLDRGALTRLTFGPASNFNPLWTHDGKRILYTSERPVFDVYSKAADGSGSEEAVSTSANDKHPLSLTPDDNTLLMDVSVPKLGEKLWLLSLAGNREAKPFLAMPSQQQTGAVSPDGHWIAYQSRESGKAEIYLEAFPAGGSRVQLSTDGGTEPVWARNGKELFYRAGKKLMAVPISVGAGSAPGRPKVLFEGDFMQGLQLPTYDVSLDGRQFYFLQKSKQAEQQARIEIILNWFEELKQRVPTGKK